MVYKKKITKTQKKFEESLLKLMETKNSKRLLLMILQNLQMLIVQHFIGIILTNMNC